ncbi:metallophosphoesterase family protein [Candidatus Woesearchaeota archaeon]|nr:metallophosphoesterase family protein [Candidatus Woesearchaeota archaeon]
MKYAIFSDVQGNYEALRKFFNQVRGRVDKYLCLGDIVQNGISFEDNLCADLVRKKGCITVRGNHEDRIIENVEVSMKKISPQNLDFLASLPSKRVVGNNYFLTHAPSDKRIISVEQAREEFIKIDFKIEFYLYGHSHKPNIFSRDKNGTVRQERLSYGANYLSADLRYMINPGGAGLYYGLPQTHMTFDDHSRELNFMRV